MNDKTNDRTETVRAANRRFICVLYGGPGTGKSSCAATARRPILWHSFDPGGATGEFVYPYTVSNIDELSREKYILLDNRFEMDDPANPTAMDLWEREFERLKRENIFGKFATWVIDSLTLMSEANMAKLLSRVKRQLPLSKGWETNDYADAAYMFKQILRKILSIPDIDIVMTGHPDMMTDDITKRKSTGLALPGSAKQTIFVAASEVYYTDAIPKPDGRVSYVLRTKTDGIYTAKSRVSTLLDEYEKQNLVMIMGKAGYRTENLAGY